MARGLRPRRFFGDFWRGKPGILRKFSEDCLGLGTLSGVGCRGTPGILRGGFFGILWSGVGTRGILKQFSRHCLSWGWIEDSLGILCGGHSKDSQEILCKLFDHRLFCLKKKGESVIKPCGGLQGPFNSLRERVIHIRLKPWTP